MNKDGRGFLPDRGFASRNVVASSLWLEPSAHSTDASRAAQKPKPVGVVFDRIELGKNPWKNPQKD
jgi:hypothetical protein